MAMSNTPTTPAEHLMNKSLGGNNPTSPIGASASPSLAIPTTKSPASDGGSDTSFGTPPENPLDASTRPSLDKSKVALSDLSITAQASGTPQSDISASTPRATPVPNVTSGAMASGVTPPDSESPHRTTTTTATTTTTTTTETPLQAAHPDPAVSALQAIFPDFDVALLQSVVEACGGDQERAIDMLLGMSDPDYVSQAPPPRQQTQEELDEELARRLDLEEQQQQQLAPPRAALGPHGYNTPFQDSIQPQQQQQVPYQPRQHHAPYGQYQSQGQYHPQGGHDHRSTSPSGQQQPGVRNQVLGAASDLGEQFRSFISGTTAPGPPGQRSDARGAQPAGGEHGGRSSELQDQFFKIADTGRKTFSSIVTKVKAKIQEFDQPPNQAHQPEGNQWSTWERQPGANPQQQHQHRQDGAPPIATLSFREEPAFPDDHPPRAPPVNTNVGPALNAPTPSSGPNVPSAPAPSATNTAPTSALLTTPRASQDGNSAPAPPRASFDTSRLGLKPKRPVSLVETPSNQSAQHGKNRDADEESLEYVSSPFDDR